MNKLKWIVGSVILLIPALFVMKYTAVPYTFYTDDVAVLKVAFQHTGARVVEYDEIGSLRKMAKKYRSKMKNQNAVKMNLKSKQGATRERHPVMVELFLDGKKIHEKEYQAMGRQKDMASVVYYVRELKPGTHKVRLTMLDTKKEGVEPFVFEDTVEFKPRDVRVLTFHHVKKKIHWSNELIPVIEQARIRDSKT